MKRARVEITGDVQGVGFRAAVAERARARGVAGFVRNRGDGSVEAAFEGDPDSVDALVAWCRRGPRGARVDGVEVEVETPKGERGFRVG